jgi:hypothetical protein
MTTLRIIFALVAHFDLECDAMNMITAYLNVSPAPQCQLGTSVHKVHVNCVSHVTLLYLLTHLGCVYNRSM